MEHNNRKVAERQLEGLKTELTEMVTQDPPTPVDECLAAVKAKKAEFALADSELVKVSSDWPSYALFAVCVCNVSTSYQLQECTQEAALMIDCIAGIPHEVSMMPVP